MAACPITGAVDVPDHTSSRLCEGIFRTCDIRDGCRTASLERTQRSVAMIGCGQVFGLLMQPIWMLACCEFADRVSRLIRRLQPRMRPFRFDQAPGPSLANLAIAQPASERLT